MNRSLLNITDDLLALDDLLSEAGGDITGVEATVDAWLAELKADLKGKVDNYAALICSMELRAGVRKDEADRLAQRAKIDANNAKFLRERLKLTLERLGVTKLETFRYRIGVTKAGGVAPLLIPDPSAIPEEYIHVREVREVDKEAIRTDLEAGRQVAGVALGTRGTYLAIR